MDKKVCFIGHREIEETLSLKNYIKEYIEELIINNNVSEFLFGSRSQFNYLCYEIVAELKEKYPKIKRVYVRNCYEIVSDWYEKYLLEWYETTIYPKQCKNSGRISYVRRNQAMIEDSDICVFYYNENYLPPRRKNAKRCVAEYQPNSGTALAFKYAIQKKKNIINFYQK